MFTNYLPSRSMTTSIFVVTFSNLTKAHAFIALDFQLPDFSFSELLDLRISERFKRQIYTDAVATSKRTWKEKLSASLVLETGKYLLIVMGVIFIPSNARTLSSRCSFLWNLHFSLIDRHIIFRCTCCQCKLIYLTSS